MMESEQNLVPVRQIILPIAEGKGWMKFLGVISIITGILTALSLFGIFIAWLPIWIGIVLFQSASAIERAHLSGSELELRNGLSKLKTYFKVQGITILIMLIIYGIVFVVFISGALLSLLSEMQ